MNKNKIGMIVGAVAGVIILVVVGQLVVRTPVTQETVAPTPTPSVSPSDSGDTKVISDVSWHGTPRKINRDLELVSYNPKLSYLEGFEYFDLGTYGDRHIIVTSIGFGMGDNISLFFSTNKSFGDPVFLKRQSFDILSEYNSSEIILSSEIDTDSESFFTGLTSPDFVTYEGVRIEKSYALSLGLVTPFFENMKESIEEDSNYATNVSKFARIKEGELYKVNYARNDSKHRELQFFLLKLPSGFGVTMQAWPKFMNSTNELDMVFSSGAKNTSYYRFDYGGGCGAPGSVTVSNSISQNDLVQTGIASDGTIIYEFKSFKHPVIQEFWNEIPLNDREERVYYDYRGGEGEKVLTQDEFFRIHGMIVYRNPLGYWVIATNGLVGPQAECGKPVIYLYPEKETAVRVKVGADITVSEPEYGDVWTVLARPDGKLIMNDGTTYDSLFWEGLGHGVYPDIKEGFIVESKNIESILISHLSQLGLNYKESQDFLDFWLPLMPKTPYTRLTWFNTKQMDKLAPLGVIPRPDSVIRIFLDFEGLQEIEKIPEQKLSTIPRKGFTLIEWGGLLKK